MKVYLASNSERRRTLMEKLGIDFEVLSPQIDEKMELDDVMELVIVLARSKAEDVIARHNLTSGVVIGADTVVMVSDTILGKPVDEEDARNILNALSGTPHYVYTGVYATDLEGKRTREHMERTKVTFYDLSEEDIQWYIDTGEYRDKAGAYGIQGQGGLLVRYVEGDYYNVVGLPIARLWRMLRDLGV
jgi:septum formation protein